RKLRAEGIRYDRLAGVTRGLCLDKGFEQCTVDPCRGDSRVDHYILQRSAGCPATSPALKFRRHLKLAWRVDGYANLRKPSFSDLREAQVAPKPAALESVDSNWKNPRVSSVRDHRGAIINLHQTAGDRYPPFGEDQQG